MKHLQRIAAGVLLILALSIPALAGETAAPPGETHTPPGQTETPPGDTQGSSITGDILGPGIISLIVSLL